MPDLALYPYIDALTGDVYQLHYANLINDPTRFLLCDGSPVLKVDYPVLYALLCTGQTVSPYGEDEYNFDLPNLMLFPLTEGKPPPWAIKKGGVIEDELRDEEGAIDMSDCSVIERDEAYLDIDKAQADYDVKKKVVAAKQQASKGEPKNPLTRERLKRELQIQQEKPLRPNLVSSRVSKGIHLPALDIDYGARLIPSSTKGHWHLYLDRPVTWRKYKKVLKAMAAADLIQPGFYKAAKKRKQTYLRKPGVMKGG